MVEGSTYTQQVQNLQFQSHWYKDHAVVKELQSPYYLGNQQLFCVTYVFQDMHQNNPSWKSWRGRSTHSFWHIQSQFYLAMKGPSKFREDQLMNLLT